jgi:hypothetical protein
MNPHLPLNLLAQIEPPAGLAAWLGCAAFVMMLTNHALRLKERLLGTNPPPAADPVTRDYCDRNAQAGARRAETIEQEVQELREERREAALKLEEKLELVTREIPELERRLNAANEARFEKVHNRINEVLGEVRELRGEVNHL